MILARIQHHPSRSALIPPLLEALKPLPTEIVIHASIPPDPWGGYRQCLSSLPDCSHVLIIQDDAQPCLNFVPALEQIAEANPSTPVCLFMGSLPASTAVLVNRMLAKGKRKPYMPLSPASFVPLVAVLWPREKAVDFLNWSRTYRTTRADDGNAARWMRQTKQLIYVAVPSLVEHNDFVVTVKGGREHRFGEESWRRALHLAEDALSFSWSATS